MTSVRPFRWNIARREQLGRLLAGPAPEIYDGFHDDLRTAAAKLLARSGDSRLAFVGRSPENFFDYLSGIFHDAVDPPSMSLLQFSDPPQTIEKIVRTRPTELKSLLGYFAAGHFDPASIAEGRPVRFVDLVNSGSTFASIYHLMQHWCRLQKVNWNAVRGKVGFVGLTSRTKNSPNTWRWQQHHDWVADMERQTIKNVSASLQFWSWIGNNEDKVTPSFRIDRWSSPEAEAPERAESHLRALRLAASLFDLGNSEPERARFAKELAIQPEMKEDWLRSRVVSLKLARKSPP